MSDKLTKEVLDDTIKRARDYEPMNNNKLCIYANPVIIDDSLEPYLIDKTLPGAYIVIKGYSEDSDVNLVLIKKIPVGDVRVMFIPHTEPDFVKIRIHDDH